jgi:hypothetical protein
MTVPASKVRSYCTSSEVALVRASRKGQLEQLSHAELKRLAVRARALFDKWRDLGRGQSRSRSRQVGFGDLDANTALKAQIFREAMESFEAQLERRSGGTAPITKAPKRKLKRHRSAEHRSNRASVRKSMTAVEDSLNAHGRRKKRPAARSAPAATPTPKPAPAAGEAATPKTKTRSTAQAVPSAKRAVKVTGADPLTQRQAASAAKKTRMVRSGKTTRMFSHIASQGKRTQARRDSKR